MLLTAKILVVSDSVAAGTKEDGAGPLLERRLIDAGFTVLERRVTPDGVEAVADALRELVDGFFGLVVTTGGTGFAPRDETPEATSLVLDREAPGFAERMRATHPLGALSRGRAGVAGSALVMNTPGSPKGALESLEAVLGLVPHALGLLQGDADHHPPETGGSTATSS
ncbi:MAG: MogA/MoaB family molybdenum cofactor biosynthesis protein [Acidimicrobiales bacterium]